MEDPSAIFSGDTITIGDGFNTPVTFEFYNGGVQTFPNPNTVVNIVGAANADDVAALFLPSWIPHSAQTSCCWPAWQATRLL